MSVTFTQKGDYFRHQRIATLADEFIMGGRPLIRDAFRDTPREELVEIIGMIIERIAMVSAPHDPEPWRGGGDA